MQKVVVLIDGEHYPANLKSSLQELEKHYRIRRVVFVGGTEKAKYGEVKKHLPWNVVSAQMEGRPNFNKIESVLGETADAEAVVDLSDEPVLGFEDRLFLANIVLLKGMIYRGADFELFPMKFEKIFSKPSIAVWGTGKRVGKTALSGYMARVLKEEGYNPGIVTLSRGGPDHPHMIRGDLEQIDVDALVRFDREGYHAASDYFEDSLMARCITFGCRRCGGGLAGKPYFSLVRQGAVMAEEHPGVDLVILEGSGTSFAEIMTDRVVLLTSAAQNMSHAVDYLGPYRILKSDLIIIAGCEPPFAGEEKLRAFLGRIREINPRVPVATVVFRPRPCGDVKNRRVFYATTAPNSVREKLTGFLQEAYGCEVVGFSFHLSHRDKLVRDLQKHGRKAEVFLTELKASAVKILARTGRKMGKDVMFCDNVPLLTDVGDVRDLEKEIAGLVETAGADKLPGKTKVKGYS